MSLYALFYFGSFFLFLALSTILLKTREVNWKLRNILILAYLVGMMLGAHALYYALCEHTPVNQSVRDFYAKLPSFQVGLLTHLSDFRDATISAGGFWGRPLFSMLILIPFVVYLRLNLGIKHDLLDVFAVSFPYALTFAKVGCFVNGCCYGVEGSGPLFIQHTWVPEHSPCFMKNCFPTQLLDLLIYLFIATVMLIVFRKAKIKGKLILWFVLYR